MTQPQNVYRILDTYNNATGPTASGQGGGASGQPLTDDFTAPSGQAAITVAHIIASVLQRPVQVGNLSTQQQPWTQVQGATPNVAITAVPSGVSF